MPRLRFDGLVLARYVDEGRPGAPRRRDCPHGHAADEPDQEHQGEVRRPSGAGTWPGSGSPRPGDAGRVTNLRPDGSSGASRRRQSHACPLIPPWQSAPRAAPEGQRAVAVGSSLVPPLPAAAGTPPVTNRMTQRAPSLRSRRRPRRRGRRREEDRWREQVTAGRPVAAAPRRLHGQPTGLPEGRGHGKWPPRSMTRQPLINNLPAEPHHQEQPPALPTKHVGAVLMSNRAFDHDSTSDDHRLRRPGSPRHGGAG